MKAPSLHAHTVRLSVVMPSDVYCASCVDRLRAATESLPGVEYVEVDKRTSTLTVMHDPSLLSEERIEDEARRLGLEVGGGIAHAAWRVTGLD